jgi:hypothetical protein
MTNPYLEEDESQPSPIDSDTVKKLPWQWITLAIAVAGLFFPMGSCDFGDLPIPVPPFVEPIVDPAKTEGSWVVVVEESEDRTPAIAKVLGDTNWWRSLEQRGLKWRHYDDDAAEAKPYLKIASEVGTPAVIVIGGQGELQSKVLAKFTLGTKEELDAKIKEVTAR